MFKFEFNKLAYISLTLLIILNTGCASIISDKNYPVTFISNKGHENFSVKNSKGHEIHKGSTPNTIPLDASDGFFDGAEYTIESESEHGTLNITRLKAGIDGWYFGNLLFGSIIGFLIVDPATGSMYSLPKVFNISTKKTSSPAPKGGDGFREEKNGYTTSYISEYASGGNKLRD
jgi:hypothetical protein